MAVREQRVCDVCQTEYVETNYGWMILVVPNAPEEVGQKEFDFCSFDCLHSWVTSPDEEEEPERDAAWHETHAELEALGLTKEQLDAKSQVDGGVAHPELQNPSITPQQRPPMTLMDAIALGAKPGFDPVRDGSR